MVFSSLVFLYQFLPICLLLYYLAPGIKFKNFVLLIFSLYFYAWGEPIWVVLLVFSSVVDYVDAIIIDKYRGKWQAKAAIITSLVSNIGLLCTFKYLDFFFSNIAGLTGLGLPHLDIALPVGISFYTFQTLSYSIDVYRNKVKVRRSLFEFLVFVSLFPQLVAGPILRYSDIADQLSSRKITIDDVSYGVTRFLCGLAKKVLLANYAGAVASRLLDSAPSSLTGLEGWLGITLYAFQIYFDFSGYSDMAIGLGRMFGFKYGENFNLPYISQSITDFWRRWHISLGAFFRDYVYIPLGGNRHRQVFNMLVVWGLTGLWHGASWNFVLWGLYFFVLLVLEKHVLGKLLNRIPRFFRWFYTMFAVLMGWMLFYFTDLSQMWTMFGVLFGGTGVPATSEMAWITLTNNIPLLIVCAIAASPLARHVVNIIRNTSPKFLEVATLVFDAVLMFLCTSALVGASYNPFLYFRF